MRYAFSRRFWALYRSKAAARLAAVPVQLLAFAFGAQLFESPTAYATKYWKNSVVTGSWNTGNNWSAVSAVGADNGGVPVGGEAVNVVSTDGTARTVTYNVSAPSLGLLSIDLTGAGAGVATLSIAGNNNLAANGILVGGYSGVGVTAGRGAMTQSAGTVSTNSGWDFVAGHGAGSTGTYTLSGTGALTANQSEYIGLNGSGTFNHSAGQNTIATATGFFDVGTYAGAVGNYNLSGTGALVSNTSEYIGDVGMGFFTQTGGTNTINGAGHHLYLGYNMAGDSNTSGTYTLSSGTLTVNSSSSEHVGYYRSGTFNQSGGTNNAGSALWLGTVAGSVGTYSLSGTGVLSTFNEYIGNSGTATFNHSAGTNNTAQLVVGFSVSPSATYNLSGTGALSVSNDETIGLSGTANLFNQTGGTHSVNGELDLGANAGTSGTYALSGGSAGIGSLYVGGTSVGGVGTGIFTVSGTGVLTAGSITVYNTPSTSLNLSGGTINTPALNLNGVPAKLNWTSGKLNVTNNVTWNSAAAGTSTSAAFGSALALGNNQTLMISGNETLGTAGVGAFSLILNSGSTHFVTGSITLNPTGTITQNAGSTLFAATFTQAGGTLNGTLQNQGNYVYQSGAFNGRLLNQGTVSLGSNFTAPNGVENDTTMTVTAGQTLTTNGAGLDNHGLFTVVTGGNLVSTSVTNQSEFVVDGQTTAATFSNSGLLRGVGKLNAAVTNAAAGDVRIVAGKGIQFSGASFTNQGLVEAIGGAASPAEVEFNGPVTNTTADGLIAGSNSLFRFDSGLTNQASFALSIGTNNVLGDVTNSATGKIIVSGGAGVTFYDDIVQNGTFRVSKVGSTASVAVVLGAFSGSGGSTGGGDIFFEGDLRPGNSPASVTFSNNISFGSGASLDIELGGNMPGAEYDQVHVNGQVALDGALAVSLIGDFSPAAGSSFDILDFNPGNLSGTFSSLGLPSLAVGLAWNTSQLYTTGVLSVVSAGTPGDYNQNGVVDAADYIVWRKNQGTTHVLPNDPLGGTIGTAQYDQWRAHFGQPPGSGAGTTANAVPEPASLVLLMCATASGCLRRGRAA